MKKFYLIVILSISAVTFVRSATLSEISDMIDRGEFDAALEAVTPLIKKSPRDAAINYWYGLASKYTGHHQQALTALSNAADRGYLGAYPELIELNMSEYHLDKAQKNIDNWRAALKKARKSEPTELSEIESRLIVLNNLLGRVEDIPVFDRVDVAIDDFDNAVERLKNPLLEKGIIFMNDRNEGITPFFINNTNREVFWTKEDENGISRLFTAGILDDGTLDQSEELSKYVGDGNILAPFMMQDGETLYFASDKGRDGLGGYDLYMTRRDGDGGFYEPSSVGMPYNSPANDFLFVIDEDNNIGWWATDRFFAKGDSVSIMFFKPNQTRVNIDGLSEDIVSRALVSDIRLTQPENFDVNSVATTLQKMVRDGKKTNQASQNSSFTLSLGNGRIITSTEQFRHSDAASLMSDVLRSRRILNDNIERLELMRNAYSDGDKSLKGDIKALESEVERQQIELKKLTNQVIQIETR